ncbi:transducin family protein / WD-40 repeat family protein [Galdieria sulphuraria]|uniref:Transducin family protein / WD-40 repeat family protein n=1 Tax=Galdieria sulphuraria TaxID=130081 RepID=M2W776_GALSU|nr:transducin family protein / WD-40 repeat family protein [Galdieria sulphuraria]EME31671.1 transducin family protein / WD-40 repeat family protein [Galdieria sulphuraria]|eukprot:XP_005708191.1 transducin family protein / WD-40 repeat family protein [Galdieria sulphuraria]
MIGMDHLAIGTYEGFLIGYDIDTQPNDPKTTTGCTLRYAYAAHERSIRCIAGSFPILASASVDESIKVYQLDQLQELATLYDLQVPVNSVDIQLQGGLLSGGEDGKLVYYPYGGWSKPKYLKGHKGNVHSVALHPTGQICLSVARDKCLKLWKTNGDCVCSLELPDEAFIVKWTEDGQGWVIATQTSFSVHSLQTGLIQQWEYSTRLVCLCALTNDIFVVGGMDGHLRLYKVGENKPIQVHKVDGGSLVKGIGVGRDGCIYSLSSKGVLEARSMQGAYRWIEQLPTSYRPTAFHVIQ